MTKSLPHADGFGFPAQDAGGDGVECPQGQAVGRAGAAVAQEGIDALAHLAGGLVGEGDRQQIVAGGAARCCTM